MATEWQENLRILLATPVALQAEIDDLRGHAALDREFGLEERACLKEARATVLEQARRIAELERRCEMLGDALYNEEEDSRGHYDREALLLARIEWLRAGLTATELAYPDDDLCEVVKRKVSGSASQTGMAWRRAAWLAMLEHSDLGEEVPDGK